MLICKINIDFCGYSSTKVNQDLSIHMLKNFQYLKCYIEKNNWNLLERWGYS
jgi:hypothetical protein